MRLLRAGRLAAPAAKARVQVSARASARVQADALLGYFSDATNAYRFGPPKYDVVSARLLVDGRSISEDFCFPAGMRLPPQSASGVRAQLIEAGEGTAVLRLSSESFLQAVAITGCVPDDNYFHLVPDQTKEVMLRRCEGTVRIDALNLSTAVEAAR